MNHQHLLMCSAVIQLDSRGTKQVVSPSSPIDFPKLIDPRRMSNGTWLVSYSAALCPLAWSGSMSFEANSNLLVAELAAATGLPV